MGTETTQEKRIRRLEDMLNALKGILEGIKHKLGQVAENDSRDTKPLSGGGGLFRFQAKEEIPGAAAPGLSSGKARTLQVVGATRYRKVPDVEIDLFNDTGGTIPVNTYGVGAVVNGLYTALVADCVTATPPAATNPPE